MSARPRYTPWFKRRRTMQDLERAARITLGLDDFVYDPCVRDALDELALEQIMKRNLAVYY